jgi:hypothetical protein
MEKPYEKNMKNERSIIVFFRVKLNMSIHVLEIYYCE